MKLAGKRIMMIDDDDVIRTLLKRVLEGVGCIAIPASGIKEALKILPENKPDLIILDLSMPELDGFSLLKFRRQNKMVSTIPVIVLSGTKDKKTIERALEMGADQFLEKPFEARIILQKLRFIFSKLDSFTYRFPTEEMPTIDCEITGEIAEQATGRMRVDSLVRFCVSKSVRVNSEDYMSQGGPPVVCKVDSQLLDYRDGLFRTTVTATGQDFDSKKAFEAWQKEVAK